MSEDALPNLPAGLDLHPSTTINGWAEFEAPCKLYGLVRLRTSRIRAYSYVSPETVMTATDIGRYCSIGHRVEIGTSVHPLNHMSSSSAFYQRVFKGQRWPEVSQPSILKTTGIGHDVWIGAHARILPGVTVGTGAVIGLGAVVSRDVPPYAVVVGNPAVVKKLRLPVETAQSLADLRWWRYDWPGCPEAAALDWKAPQDVVPRMQDLINAGKVALIPTTLYRINETPA